MNADRRCEEVRELLPELALGIADGAERARVLEHVADCPECSRELERQSAIADELLTLAPAEEPSPGFELAALRRIAPPSRPATRRRLALVAVIAAAVALTAGGMQLAFRDDLRVADHYRGTLERAGGSYFGSAPLTDAAGGTGGVLFAYRGSPSWILVTVDQPHRRSVQSAELVAKSGRRIPLPSFRLAGGAWGGAIPLDLSQVAAIHLVGNDGRSVLVGEL
jgi:Putative zinc-finger